MIAWCLAGAGQLYLSLTAANKELLKIGIAGKKLFHPLVPLVVKIRMVYQLPDLQITLLVHSISPPKGRVNLMQCVKNLCFFLKEVYLFGNSLKRD